MGNSALQIVQVTEIKRVTKLLRFPPPPPQLRQLARRTKGIIMSEESEKGRTIQLLLTDGTPSGLTIATLHGWTGSVMVAHNPTLPDLLNRDEATRTGVYVLYGPDPDDDTKKRA